MIKFINESVLFVDDCGATISRDFGACYQVEQLRGEMFTKEEVRYMLDNMGEFIRLYRTMKERKNDRAAILTMPVSMFVGKETDKMETINPRYVNFRFIETFIDSIPTLARWL
jgi:hypothetical protein